MLVGFYLAGAHRDGRSTELTGTPPSEDATSIDATYAMRQTFSDAAPVVRAIFHALVEPLSGHGARH